MLPTSVTHRPEVLISYGTNAASGAIGGKDGGIGGPGNLQVTSMGGLAGGIGGTLQPTCPAANETPVSGEEVSCTIKSSSTATPLLTYVHVKLPPAGVLKSSSVFEQIFDKMASSR
jgi:hypothetical protein